MAASLSPVPAANAGSVAFEDDFESGNLNKWPRVLGDGEATIEGAHTGSWSFKAFNDPTTIETKTSSKTYLEHATAEPSRSLYRAGGYWFSAFFFFPESFPAVRTNFMQLKEGGGAGGTSFRPLAVVRRPNGLIEIFSGIENRPLFDTGTPVPLGRWFNITILVQPGKPGVFRVYLDGVLIADLRTDTLGDAEWMYFGAGNYLTGDNSANGDIIGPGTTLYIDNVRVTYFKEAGTFPPPPSGGDDPPSGPAPGPAPPPGEPGTDPFLPGTSLPVASYPVAWGTSAPRQRNLSTAVLTAIDSQRYVSADLVFLDLPGSPMFVALAGQSLDFARPGVDILPIRWLGVGGAMILGTAEETGEMDGGGEDVQFAAEDKVLDFAPRLLYADLFNRWYEHWVVYYADEGPEAGRPVGGYLHYGGVANGKPIVEDVVDESGYRAKMIVVRFRVLPPLALVSAGTSMQTNLRSHQRWYPGDLGMDQVTITRNRRIWFGTKGPIVEPD